MLLRDHTLTQFTEVLSSGTPAPGGGAAAALSGALAASLVAMTGALTVTKEKYKEYHAEIQGIMDRADQLRENLLAGVDEDTEAYGRVAAVFKMPKADPGQKASRAEAMQEALKGAAIPPLEAMRLALACVELAYRSYGKINASCASDLGVAALCGLACVKSAWLNVKINLASVRDKEFIDKILPEACDMLDKAEKLAGEIYQKIEAEIPQP